MASSILQAYSHYTGNVSIISASSYSTDGSCTQNNCIPNAAIDGDLSSFWNAGRDGWPGPNWLVFDFGEEGTKLDDEFCLYSHGDVTHDIKTFQLQYSNNSDGPWISLNQWIAKSGNVGWQYFNTTNSTKNAYQYWRLYIIDRYSIYQTWLPEILFFCNKPNLTNNNMTNQPTMQPTADKGCDRLEYIDTSLGRELKIIPAGVCYPSLFGSEMLVCNNANTMRILSWWSSDRCQGEVTYSESIQESLSYDDPENISIICCTGNQCPYANIIVYDFDDIAECSDAQNRNGEINLIESYGGPYLIGNGSCVFDDFWGSESYDYQCSNGTFIKQEYDNNLHCEGTVDNTDKTIDGDCSGSESCSSCSSGIRTQITDVICGVAMDTCGISYPSGAQLPASAFNHFWFGLLLIFY